MLFSTTALGDVFDDEKAGLIDRHADEFEPPLDSPTKAYGPPPGYLQQGRTQSMRTVHPMTSNSSLPMNPYPPDRQPPRAVTRSNPRLPNTAEASPDQMHTPSRRIQWTSEHRKVKSDSGGSRETVSSTYSTQSGEGRRNSSRRVQGWKAYEAPRPPPQVPLPTRDLRRTDVWRPVTSGGLPGHARGAPVRDFGA
jgi:hypothetical protein